MHSFKGQKIIEFQMRKILDYDLDLAVTLDFVSGIAAVISAAHDFHSVRPSC